MVSVLILTLNEEKNITKCIESISWCEDIVVLDSISEDRTTEIAQKLGARVIEREFDNWASHQNWAMENIDFDNEWVFYLDADERMTEPLRNEIFDIAEDPSEDRVAFYVGRRNYFMGTWIKHAMPPSPVMRFFKPPHIRFERLVNPTPVVDGEYGYLENYFDHYNFSKGITEWIAKHNRYSLAEAKEAIKTMRKGREASLLSTDQAERRKALKQLAYQLPMRPLAKFLYLFIFKRGFLDGYPGFLYCTLQMMYEYMITLKMIEVRHEE